MRWTMAAGAAILSLGALVGTGTTAEARDGCGPGFHRNWSGWCRPNFYGPRVHDGPIRYRPIVYGPRWGYGWHRPWGYGGWRRVGWHRPWGYHGGWHRVGWGGGWGHHGWHHRW